MRFLEIVAASATTLSSPFDGLSRNVEKDFLRKVKFFEEGKSFCFLYDIIAIYTYSSLKLFAPLTTTLI